MFTDNAVTVGFKQFTGNPHALAQNIVRDGRIKTGRLLVDDKVFAERAPLKLLTGMTTW